MPPRSSIGLSSSQIKENNTTTNPSSKTTRKLMKRSRKKMETAAMIDFSLTSGESRSEGQECGLHAAELPPPNRSTASFTERNGTELSTSPLPLLFFASSSITPAAEATERRGGGGGDGRTFIIITPFSFTQRDEAHTQMRERNSASAMAARAEEQHRICEACSPRTLSPMRRAFPPSDHPRD